MPYSISKIYEKNTNTLLFTEVRIPNGFYQKAKGLLGKNFLSSDEGMLFNNCSSIHMIGMRIPLDIIYLSNDGIILKCIKNLAPWKISFCFKASKTLEIAAGSIEKLGLKTGMKLEIVNV